MAVEEFDAEEMRAVKAAFEGYEERCERIMQALNEKRTLTRHERQEIEALYSLLKSDLKQAAKVGTVSGAKRPLNRVEQCFFQPAVFRAAIELRPATNTHPISSGWFSAVYSAKSEFSYYRHNRSEPNECAV